MKNFKEKMIASYIVDNGKVHVLSQDIELEGNFDIKDIANELKIKFNLDLNKKYPVGVIVRSDVFDLVQLTGTKLSVSYADQLIEEYKVNIVAYLENGQPVYSFYNGFDGNIFKWINREGSNADPVLILLSNDIDNVDPIN